MTMRTRNRQGTQGERRGSSALEHLIAPLVGGMTATRESLLAWVHECGVVALNAVFREQAEAVAGPKGQHQAGRTHHHWGTTPTELTLGGGRIQVPRPRVRGREGGEVTLPAVAAFRGRDPLTARVVEQILLGVSTRGYAASLEAGPIEGRLLCVIDGGKGLRRALQDVFGDVAVIQRCQVHKRRNLQALVPKGRQRRRRPATAAPPGAVARGQWPRRRRGESAGGPGGDPHSPQARAAAPAAAGLRDD